MANLPIKTSTTSINPIFSLPTWASENNVYMIVEINKGTITKYELITECGLLMVDRVGYSSLAYPFCYGAIPATLDKDNDPLDIMLYDTTESLIPGCILEARVVGAMEMIDGGEEDHKVLAVVASDRRFDHITSLNDIPKQFIEETEYFWQHYKELKKPGSVKTGDWLDIHEAIKLIKNTQDAFEVAGKSIPETTC